MIHRSCRAPSMLGAQVSPPAPVESKVPLAKTAGGDACAPSMEDASCVWGPSCSSLESTEASSEFSKQNRAAFQILFAKLRYDSTCFSFQRVSVLPTCAKVKR